MPRKSSHAPPVPAVTIVPHSKGSINLYYNASKHNDTESNIPAEFYEMRDAPLAKKASNYKASVIYMDISLVGVRIFNTGNRDLSVTMTYPPDGLSSTQDLFPGPTDIFNLNDILIALGAAFQAATDDIISQYDAIYGAGAWAGDATKAQLYPYAVFFSTSRLFSFYNDVRNTTSNYSGAPTPILMFLSPFLLNLFKSIMSNPTTGQVLFPALPGQNNFVQLSPPEVAGTYVSNLQIYNSTELWFDVQSVILVSNKLGNRPEFIGIPAEDGSNIQIPILAEFNTVISAGESNNPTTRIVYYPTAEYRWVDMKSDSPIQEFDFKFYYTDRAGNVFPIYLSPGDSFRIHMIFSIRAF